MPHLRVERNLLLQGHHLRTSKGSALGCVWEHRARGSPSKHLSAAMHPTEAVHVAAHDRFDPPHEQARQAIRRDPDPRSSRTRRSLDRRREVSPMGNECTYRSLTLPIRARYDVLDYSIAVGLCLHPADGLAKPKTEPHLTLGH